jgi:hypothetical protein
MGPRLGLGDSCDFLASVCPALSGSADKPDLRGSVTVREFVLFPQLNYSYWRGSLLFFVSTLPPFNKRCLYNICINMCFYWDHLVLHHDLCHSLSLYLYHPT